MERPYDADESGTWHKDVDCEEFEGGRVSDANLDGLHKGVSRHGEGVCPECFPAARRQEIFGMARKQAEMDA
jgi:hypothetical protein